MAVRIAEALDVSLDWLVGLNDELLEPATTKRILDLQNPSTCRPRGSPANHRQLH